MTTSNTVRMPVEPTLCPFCGGRRAQVTNVRDGLRVSCGVCLAEGPPMFYGPEDRIVTRNAAIAAWNRAAAPAPQPVQGEAVAWSVVGIGNRGAAYDGPKDCRAYTYQHQPGNLEASRLGSATHDAMNMSAGDSIDRGLCLLKALQAHGFGVFQLGTATPAVQIAAPDEGDMARALEDLRQSSIPSRSYDLIAEAIAAYDPERMAKCGNTVAAPGDVERSRFESWVNEALNFPGIFDRDSFGNYRDKNIDLKWCVWSSARAPILSRLAEAEDDHSQALTERDHAQDIIDKLCDAVLGANRREWSSMYFFEDAVEEVEDEIAALRSQPVAAPGDVERRSVGTNAKTGKPLWHCDFAGLYWTGHHYHRTREQLISECESTLTALAQQANTAPLAPSD